MNVVHRTSLSTPACVFCAVGLGLLALSCSSPRPGLSVSRTDVASSVDQVDAAEQLPDGISDTGISDIGGGEAALVKDRTTAAIASTCGRWLKCEKLPVFGTLEGCIAVQMRGSQHDIDALIAAVQDNLAKFDAGQASLCLTAFDSASCDVRPDDTACRNAFRGTLAVGDGCTTDEACKSRYCKKVNPGCETGICSAQGVAGAACLRSAACQVGLQCAGHTCIPASSLQPAGQPCSTTNQCSTGLSCVGAAGSGVCSKPAQPGESCLAQSCAEGLYCAADHKCAKQGGVDGICTVFDVPTWVQGSCVTGSVCIASPAGAACKQVGHVGDLCAADSQCQGGDVLCVPDASGSGHCKVVPSQGQPCNVLGLSNGKPFTCLPPWVCVNSVCAAPPGESAPCSLECGADLGCDLSSHSCKPLPGPGQACFLGAVCRSDATCELSGSSKTCVALQCVPSTVDADTTGGNDAGDAPDSDGDASMGACGDGLCTLPETNAACTSDCFCGNGTCEYAETPLKCPADCPEGCGDAICEEMESTKICPFDCFCGNKSCDSGESHVNCSTDCPTDCGDGVCAASKESKAKCQADCFCGNGSCDQGESAKDCPQDCAAGCGDLNCSPKESPTTCPADCFCGNYECSVGETSANCPVDCKLPCGNSACEPNFSENQYTCGVDCFCGNGTCEKGFEDTATCQQDCCKCGNGACEMAVCKETMGTCPADCPAQCGNGKCNAGETLANCPIDCCKCGDGVCGSVECAESAATCPVDCLPCGDGICQPGQTKQSCPQDCCGPSPAKAGWCGDAYCAGSECQENQATCPLDCCVGGCGDKVCSGAECGETAQLCPMDCVATCGTCICDAGEDAKSCPGDCGKCGDGYCATCLKESQTTCPADCKP